MTILCSVVVVLKLEVKSSSLLCFIYYCTGLMVYQTSCLALRILQWVVQSQGCHSLLGSLFNEWWKYTSQLKDKAWWAPSTRIKTHSQRGCCWPESSRWDGGPVGPQEPREEGHEEQLQVLEFISLAAREALSEACHRLQVLLWLQN